MLLSQRLEPIIDPDRMTFTTPSPFAAVTKQITIPASGPIESIWIILTMTMKVCALNTLVTFGIPNILKRATLNIHNGQKQFDCVNASGPGLLMLNDLEGLTLDPATRQAIWASNMNLGANGVPTVAGQIHRVAYKIPCVHPGLAGWLAVRSMLHTQTHRQEPILTLDFAPAAEIFTGADPFSAVTLEVFVERRDITDDLTKALQDSGGFIDWDIRETIKQFPAGINNTEQFIELPGDREYASLALWHEKNGATLGDMSGNTTAGTETVWSLEAAQNSKTKWRMKYLALLNAITRAGGVQSTFYPQTNAVTGISTAGVTTGAPPVWLTAATPSGSPWLGGALSAGMAIQDPAFVGFEFLSDGNNGATELSSALSNRFRGETRYQIKGNLTTPAGNPSFLKFCARAYLSDITPFKKLPLVAA
jgi:hypothetical protein